MYRSRPSSCALSTATSVPRHRLGWLAALSIVVLGCGGRTGLSVDPEGEPGSDGGVPDQLVLASAYTVAGSALTNALGGAAGEALAARRKDEA